MSSQQKQQDESLPEKKFCENAHEEVEKKIVVFAYVRVECEARKMRSLHLRRSRLPERAQERTRREEGREGGREEGREGAVQRNSESVTSQ